MNVAMHHVGFSYLGITLQPSVCGPPGHNATNALCNIEYFYGSGLCVGFA